MPRRCAAEGADLVDIGGGNRRGRGAQRRGGRGADAADRAGVRGALAGRISAILSVDTTRSQVAAAAVERGAMLINDISAGLDDPGMLATAARLSVPMVLMHMQGQPATMQVAPNYADVVAEVIGFLQQRMAAAEQAGIARGAVCWSIRGSALARRWSTIWRCCGVSRRWRGLAGRS